MICPTYDFLRARIAPRVHSPLSLLSTKSCVFILHGSRHRITQPSAKLQQLLPATAARPNPVAFPHHWINHWGVYGEIWLGEVSCSSVSCIKPIPTQGKKLLAVGKKWPKCRFYPNFSWVGFALGWRVRRFHDNIYMFSNPT